MPRRPVLVAAIVSALALAPAAPGQALPEGVTTDDWNGIQHAYLKASNTNVTDQFGISVAVSGDTVVVGANWEDSTATGVNGDQDNNDGWRTGAAYVFVRDGGEWSQQAYLKASNTEPDGYPEGGDGFGWSVAVSGDTIVIGAPIENSSATGVNGDPYAEAAAASGAAYVFVRDGTTWSQQAYLKASNTGAVDTFGWSVAICGDTVVVGAKGEDSGATGVDGDGSDDGSSGSGAAYVFVREGTTWTQQAYLKASNTGQKDEFGGTVAISGDTAVVGAFKERSSAPGVNGDQTSNDLTQAGAAYVFVRAGSTWSQQAYLKAVNPGYKDRFGRTVAVWGDTVVVGAPGEGSSSTGVNGGYDNDAWSSGAVYVFTREDTAWKVQAFLKASNTNPGDSFGRSVAVSDTTIVVGADGEDSDATGVNGNEKAGGATSSGAAYVFVRSGAAMWSQHAYLKASNTGADDRFGQAVSVSGDTVVVGAYLEAGAATGVNGDQGNGATSAGAAYLFAPGPWTGLGHALEGMFGDPVLNTAGTLVAGQDVSLTLWNARKSAPAWLAVGADAANAPFKGGVFVPDIAPPGFLAPMLTSASGEIELSSTWPQGIPAGTPFYVQFWIEDDRGPKGFAASNAVEGVTPTTGETPGGPP